MAFKSNTSSFLAIYALMSLLHSADASQGYNETCQTNAPETEIEHICDTDKFLVCRVPHTNVYEGTCLCDNNSHYDGQNDLCRANANSACTTGATAQPCGLKSVCTNSVCRCEPGGFGPTIKGNTKICVGGYNAVCNKTSPTDNRDCDTTAGFSCMLQLVDPSVQRCQCDEASRSIYSEIRKKCVNMVGKSCTVDNDCTENANCVNNVCRCVAGYSMNPMSSNKCQLAYNSTCADVATPCNSYEKTECKSGRCECRDNTRLSSNVLERRCLSVVTPVGESCEKHDDCFSKLCVNSTTAGVMKCVCPAGQIALEDGTCAVLGVEDTSSPYNRYCLDNTQCDKSNFLVCNQNATEPAGLGRCQCDPAYTTEFIGLGLRCVVPLEGNCSNNRNCVSRSVCVENKCVCSAGYSKVNEGSTTCQAEVNVQCSRDEDCRRDYGLFCSSSRNCSCPIGQEWSAVKSHCEALVSGNCTVDTNYCWENSHCTAAGACECDEGFSHTDVFERKCLRSFGQNCTAAENCNTYNFLTCNSTGICDCKYPSQQTFDPAEGKCVSISGGVCGVLPENRINGVDLNMTCQNQAECLPDVQGILRCSCTGNPGTAVGQLCGLGGGALAKSAAKLNIFLILSVSLAFSFVCFKL